MVEKSAIQSKSKSLFDRLFSYLKSLSFRNTSFYLALGIVFSMPLPRPLGLAFVYLWIISTLLEGNIVAKARQNLNRLSKIYITLLVAFAIIHIASALLSENIDEGFLSLNSLTLAFVFLFVFLISNDIYQKKINILLFAFVLGNIVALAFCIINSFIESVHFTGNDWYFQSSLTENLDFLSSLKKGRNHFTYVHFSIFKHPSYFAMYSIFSMGILTYFARIRFMKRWLIIVLLLYLLLGVFLLSSRAGILSVFIYSLFSLFVYFRNKPNFMLKFPAVVIALSAILLLVFSQSRMDKTIKATQGKTEKKEGRIGLWKSSWELAKKNWIFGVGIGDIDDKREKVYTKNQIREKLIDKNSHNQYFEVLLGTGIFGLFVFLLMLIIPLMQSIKEKNYLLTLFIFLVGFNLLFESMLNRFQGVFFIFFFLSLFFLINPDKLKNTTLPKIKTSN